MRLCRIFLNPDDLTLKLLRSSTSYFGYNPRQCFGASLSARYLKFVKSNVEANIKAAASSNIMQLLIDAQTGGQGSVVPHTIFQISPTEADKKQLLSRCQIGGVSRWALDCLLCQYKTHKAHMTAKFYQEISTMDGAEALRGHMFEWQVLNYLQDIRDDRRVFSILSLIDPDSEVTWTNSDSEVPVMWTYQPTTLTHFQGSTVIKEITEAVRDRKRLHLVPLVPNFPAVDSILYDPDDPDAVLTCIQITRRVTHPIAVSGLQRIQSWLKLRSPLTSLRPSIAKPWRFLFVVPLNIASTYKFQKFEGDTTTKAWAGKVHQYVLGLGERTIFGGISDSSAITLQEGQQQVWC